MEVDAQQYRLLYTFALTCQRIYATPGCENEPLKPAYLPLLAEKIRETADIRERLEAAKEPT